MGRNHTTKLKGFTILELLIALAISAIVVAAGYTVLQLSSELFIRSSISKTEKSTYIKFNYLLRKNFFESHLIFLNDDRLYFIQDDSVLVSYDFISEHIIRNQQEVSDTFLLKDGVYAYGFEGAAILNGHVDSLIITFNEEDEKNIVVLKEYTAKSLMDIKNAEQ